MKLSARLIAAAVLVAALFLALTGDLGPRDAVISEGVQPAPQWLIERRDPYLRYGSMAFLDWHPTRLEMVAKAYRYRSGQLYRVLYPGARRQRLTALPSRSER
jgi:hypothetical protein